MPIRSILFILAGIIGQNICSAQSSIWQRSTQWTIYNPRGVKFGTIPLDSLDSYSHKPISTDTMHLYLEHSSTLASNDSPVWMGAFVTSCVIEGKKRKIDISTYGGFLFDETEGKYYEIQQEYQKDWLNYLAGCVGSLSSQK